MDPSYQVVNVDEIPSPSLLIYRERVRDNIHRMRDMAGGTERLRPHVKTHKTKEIVRMEAEAGITMHKCATLMEARMLAETGAPDVFIAYQMVGPNIKRLVDLARQYPGTTFRAMVDHPDAARALSDEAVRGGVVIDALVDLDVGQHRTGIAPGPDTIALYELLDRLPGVQPGGLHGYDGHNHQSDIEARNRATAGCLEQVRSVRRQLETRGLPVARCVMGGTVSFPYYAQAKDVEVSPGTCVLHDGGYLRRFPDLPFVPAALLLSRIISILSSTRATLDLGHKAIAADPAPPRGVVWNIDGVELGLQNEEHWVMETADTSSLRIGQPVYVLPSHICPTCALHRQMYVIDGEGRCTEQWEVAARNRE